MSIATINKKLGQKPKSRAVRKSQRRAVNDAIGVHARTIRRLEDVKHYLGGLAAVMYLPGKGQNFINPVRGIKNTNPRPTMLTMEVTPELGFQFTGAVSRLRRGNLAWTTVFAYDAARPMQWSSRGGSIPAANLTLARRAIELLRELSGYGRRVSFNMAEPLEMPVFPRVMWDTANQITGEDYSPVLGLAVDNPAFSMVGQMVAVHLPNPAEKVLAQRGIEFPASLDSTALNEAVAALVAAIPAGINLSWADAVDALMVQRPYIRVSVPYEAALQIVPDQVVAAIRKQLPKPVLMEATYSDIHRAALNPTEELKLSRLSRIQLVESEWLAELPDGYAGSVLPPVEPAGVA